MTDVQFKDLDRFVSYAEKQFDLPLLAGCFADGRADPQVPSRAVGLSLLLGEVAQIRGLLQLEQETKLPQWQRWVGYDERKTIGPSETGAHVRPLSVVLKTPPPTAPK